MILTSGEKEFTSPYFELINYEETRASFLLLQVPPHSHCHPYELAAYCYKGRERVK